MIKSMTGYGYVQKNYEDFQTTVEIKTLNNRHFDCKLNIPDKLTPYEFKIQDQLRETLQRGKVNCSITIDFNQPEFEKKALNRELFKSYFLDFVSVARELNQNEDQIFNLVAGFREVYQEPKMKIDENQWQLILDDIREAIVKCDQYRKEEGGKLKKVFESYGQNIGAMTSEIDDIKGDRLDNVKAKLEKSLVELQGKGFEHNPERLEQEMIYYAEKLDISEEIVRLNSHIEYYEQLLEKEDAGRSLNFIAQEMNREINTIGSKANNSEIQHKVVKLKEELEKIREQIQNVV